jgi:DNA-binding response OmpR family regulator
MNKPVVLLLEDEMLISMALEADLSDAGFSVVAARSCREAAEFLAEHRPDAAVLDVQLSDGECIPAAQKLIDEQVPFIVHSAFLTGQTDPVFRHGTFVGKPGKPDEIVDLLKDMTQSFEGELSSRT